MSTDFAASAARLAGFAGLAFGWTPEAFWHATPAELSALATAMAGDAGGSLGTRELAQLMEEHPDG